MIKLVQAFEEVNNIKIPYEIVVSMALVSRIQVRQRGNLGWKDGLTIDDMCLDSWNFERNYRE
jgi:UDP-glucose 4-epimerase